MRNAFLDTLYELALEDERIQFITGDLGFRVVEKFMEKIPNQFLNAGVAEQNSSRALSMAQKLSDQLRAAEDRIAELETESATYREKADRAEQWLHKVYTEIEDRFFRDRAGSRRMRA